MMTPRKSIFAALVVIGAIASVTAQLSYHSDANTNSYTLQTPNSQQTFTRYYGQQQSGNGIAAGQLQGAQSQQQPSFQENVLQSQNDLYLRQQQQQLQQQQYQQQEQEQQTILQQQQQQQQQQQLLLQQQQQQQQQYQQQEQTYASQDLGLYYQQLQQAQQTQRAQEQQHLQSQQYVQAQQSQPQQYVQQQNGQELKQQANLLGVAFSPSNEVSHVKYTSNALNYNF